MLANNQQRKKRVRYKNEKRNYDNNDTQKITETIMDLLVQYTLQPTIAAANSISISKQRALTDKVKN